MKNTFWSQLSITGWSSFFGIMHQEGSFIFFNQESKFLKHNRVHKQTYRVIPFTCNSHLKEQTDKSSEQHMTMSKYKTSIILGYHQTKILFESGQSSFTGVWRIYHNTNAECRLLKIVILYGDLWITLAFGLLKASPTDELDINTCI